jgi:D-glycero-D-manno-heptose 1,7-bisphosphate phosphatase
VRPAVFLDRDDTLVACRGVAPFADLGKPELVRLLPLALVSCRRLKDAGFALVVVSNQGGVARGRYTESAVEAVNAEINAHLQGLIDRFYWCPFHPEGTVPAYAREHPWRKPQPGMLLAAAQDLALDLDRSWMVGDQPRDCAAGRAAGCRTILVGPLPAGEEASLIDFIAPDLGVAADIVLRSGGAP